MHELSIDLETFSSVDLKKSGMHKYAQSPDFEILMLAYAFDDAPVQILDFKGTVDQSEVRRVFGALGDPSVIKRAYNAAFELCCLNRNGEITPPEQWRCTMAHGLYCGYPMGLGKTCEAVGLPQDKRKLGTGMSLIRTFCVPQKPTKSNGNRTRTQPGHEPEKWQLFKAYCKQDVEAERALYRRLSLWPMPEKEQRLWAMDVRMNTLGVKVDDQLMLGALHLGDISQRKLIDEAKEITGLENPKSNKQLLSWLKEALEDELDEELDNVRKDTVKDLLAQGLENKGAERLLILRQQFGKTSTTKYDAMHAAVCEDGRVRGLLQYYGANRTGRYAGRLVQIQNLPRNYLKTLDIARRYVRQQNLPAIELLYGNVPDTLSQLIRTAFVPEEGRSLIVVDFSAIEARTLAWLAGEQWVNEVFATHGLIYEAAASQMFGVPLDRIAKGNPEYALRQKGKVATLALGYAGSTGAMINLGALREGLVEDELPDIVKRWRQTNPNIVRMWYAVEKCAMDAVQNYTQTATHGLIFTREGDIKTGQDFLTILLPSGRKLFYAHPYIAEGRFEGKMALHYQGMDQKTKKWSATSTFGGKLVENITQAVARDCLAEALLKADARGHKITFHVHDEIIVEGQPEALDDLLDIMAEPIPWAPGLVLKGDGFVADFYRKD